MIMLRHQALVSLGIALLLPAAAVAQQRLPIVEQVAKTYGIQSFGEIVAIRYTFNAMLPGIDLSRSWIWEPNSDQVTYEAKDKSGKRVKVTYRRSQIGRQSAEVKDKIDPGFVNDQYWLLLPFHAYWDGGTSVDDTGIQKLPSERGSAEKVVVKYQSNGGYSEGDTWELYVGPDSRIREMVFRRGGAQKPQVVIVSWADYRKAGPLLFSLDHRGTADGKPVRVFFSHVAVKLVGSNSWIEAQ